MINDFIGGGQVFLHKLRMFYQVLERSFTVALLISVSIVLIISYKPAKQLDFYAAMTYQKALFFDGFYQSLGVIRKAVNPKVKYYPQKIDAYTKHGLYAEDIETYKVLKSRVFKVPYNQTIAFLKSQMLIGFSIITGIFCLIYAVWCKFGKDIKSERHISGAIIKNAKEVTRYLTWNKKASFLKIGDMPLVKDSETKHIIITGSSGSGKTNLIHHIFPQVIKAKQPAVIIDQTGEMIARYYNPERGDIIFNPLDQRSHSWDFWLDNTSNLSSGNINPQLENFAKVLFKFGKKPNVGSDPFWDNSSETIFCACVEQLIKTNNKSFAALQRMLTRMTIKELTMVLADTEASKYLNEGNLPTISSILSVMATNTKPLRLLRESDRKFSLKEHFNRVGKGSNAILFLSNPPNLRAVTMPLIASLFELSLSYLIELGINRSRRMWFVIDELASLGRLNSLSVLMSESRKYGGCVLSATQSINQIFANFGQYEGSSIFGQFGTKFVFRTDEPASTKIITDICGKLEYAHQQKNTSFGANEFRDGISYTEQQKYKSVINTEDLAALNDHECFILLPEPKIRIAKVTVPLMDKVKDQHLGFIQSSDWEAQKSLPDTNITQDSNIGFAQEEAAQSSGVEINEIPETIDSVTEDLNIKKDSKLLYDLS